MSSRWLEIVYWAFAMSILHHLSMQSNQLNNPVKDILEEVESRQLMLKPPYTTWENRIKIFCSSLCVAGIELPLRHEGSFYNNRDICLAPWWKSFRLSLLFQDLNSLSSFRHATANLPVSIPDILYFTVVEDVLYVAYEKYVVTF